MSELPLPALSTLKGSFGSRSLSCLVVISVLFFCFLCFCFVLFCFGFAVVVVFVFGFCFGFGFVSFPHHGASSCIPFT